MGPKKGGNSKADEARVKKESVVSAKQAKEDKEREEAAWRDDGGKSKSSKKKEEDAERKAEAAAKKLEDKKLAEAEDRELDKAVKKGIKSEKVSKVTAADLAKLKVKEQEQLAQATAAAKKKAARVAGEDEYAKLVDVANTNRVETLIDAHSLSEAVEQLSVEEKETGGGDSHPERRMKAAYKVRRCAVMKIIRTHHAIC